MPGRIPHPPDNVQDLTTLLAEIQLAEIQLAENGADNLPISYAWVEPVPNRPNIKRPWRTVRRGLL